MELCVKTAQPLPHFAPEHQEGSRRLLDLTRSIQIQIQAAIAPVHWIPRQHAIDPEYLQYQRQGRRKPPHSEARLYFARFVEQFSRRYSRPRFAAGLL